MTASASASAWPAAVPDPAGKTISATGDAAASEDVEASAVWKHVWHTAPAFDSAQPGGMRTGYLYAGNNYFHCQIQAIDWEFNGYENNWWLKTDDDHGNTDVWVNAVYVSGGANFEPIAGVPYC